MIAIIDYGMGNLRSVQKAFEKVGFEAVVTGDAQTILAADGVVLPGVAAFGDTMYNIKQAGMIEVIKQVVKQGTPFLGVCVGMQCLFSTSEEKGMHLGLGLIPGHVKKFRSDDLKIPQIGWNDVIVEQQDSLLSGVQHGDYVYFVHSYYCEPMDSSVVLASADYGGPYAAMVRSGNVWGMQFHPEKSSDTGLRMLQNFAKVCYQENPTEATTR